MIFHVWEKLHVPVIIFDGRVNNSFYQSIKLQADCIFKCGRLHHYTSSLSAVKDCSIPLSAPTLDWEVWFANQFLKKFKKFFWAWKKPAQNNGSVRAENTVCMVVKAVWLDKLFIDYVLCFHYDFAPFVTEFILSLYNYLINQNCPNSV